MDSLSLYRSFCKNGKQTDSKDKYGQVDQVIACIHSEIFAPPFETSRSPFLCETANMLREKRGSKGLSVVDAYVILSGLCDYIRDPSYQTAGAQGGIVKYLFCNQSFPGNQEKSKERIVEYMREIRLRTEEAKHSYEGNAQRPKTAERPDVTSAQRPKTAAEALPEPPSDREDRSSLRQEQNQDKVRKWHEEQEEIRQSLLKMQPSVRSLMEDFLSFSDRIKENYVLQFARQQIELYDLIADAYAYHKDRAEKRKDEDYRNAVQNYEEYLDMIVDALAAFGIEEIKSEPGCGFDGGIHETDTDRFSAKSAAVTRSVRSGFRYQEIVIQKEKVIL